MVDEGVSEVGIEIETAVGGERETVVAVER